MRLKGIVPGHRIQWIPEEKGILISFSKTEIDLNNLNIFPGELFQIKLVDNMRSKAKNMLSKEQKKNWCFCFIEGNEIIINDKQLEMAMNLKFLPESRLYTHEQYKRQFKDERINVKLSEDICIDEWKLGKGLPELSQDLNKEIWMP